MQDSRKEAGAGSRNNLGAIGSDRVATMGSSKRRLAGSRQDRTSKVSLQQTRSCQRGRSNVPFQSHLRDCTRYALAQESL